MQLADTPIRVALIEPGFIDTPIFDDFPMPRKPEPGVPYETVARRSRIAVSANMADAAPPEGVADLALKILNGDTWALRNPAGPDAERLSEQLDIAAREFTLNTFRLTDDHDWAKAWGPAFGREYNVDI